MNNIFSICFRLITIFLMAAPIYPETNLEAKVGFKDYEFSQYVRAKGKSPQGILEMDNNGDIIIACTSKKTKDQLSSQGIPLKQKISRI